MSSSNNAKLSDSTGDASLVSESLWSRIVDAALKVNIHRHPRRLRICETLSLGEKRLLMIVQCEQKRFLIGATPQSVSLLQALDTEQLTDHESKLS